MDRAATSLPSAATTFVAAAPKRLNVFERYLSLWVGLCMVVALIAIPILIQVYFNSSLTYGLMRLFKVEYAIAAPGARVDRVTQFTALEVRARLRVPSGANEEQAQRLLTKAEETCLVTNSLKVRPHVESVVEIGEP